MSRNNATPKLTGVKIAAHLKRGGIAERGTKISLRKSEGKSTMGKN